MIDSTGSGNNQLWQILGDRLRCVDSIGGVSWKWKLTKPVAVDTQAGCTQADTAMQPVIGLCVVIRQMAALVLYVLFFCASGDTKA